MGESDIRKLRVRLAIAFMAGDHERSPFGAIEPLQRFLPGKTPIWSEKAWNFSQPLFRAIIEFGERNDLSLLKVGSLN